MKKLKLSIIIIMYVAFSKYNVNSQTTENYSNVKIANSLERTFHSEIYNQKITLQIYLPMGYYEQDTTFNKFPFLQKEHKDSYPVLYLLDADVYFGMAAVISRLLQWENKSPGIIIVGVSYGLSEWWSKRQLDYYPFSDSSFNISGNASEFLKMYQNELIPYVESNFRADNNNRILYGHSAGGVFALYALFSKPELFQGYISASISTKYLSKFFFDIEAKYSIKRNELPVKLYLSMGSLEQKDYLPEWERIIDNLTDRNYNNLKIKKVIIEEESHLPAAPISLVKGLEWYFSK